MQRLATVGQHIAGSGTCGPVISPRAAALEVAAVAGDAPLRVGVIGAGGMGGRHATNIAHRISGATVSGIFDMDAARASEVARECGDAQVFNSANALIESAEIDAVVIASPDSTHAALALACVRAGKPVLCEKPLAPSAAEALAVVEAEVNGGKKLIQLGFMRQYDPAHVKVKQALDGGKIGRLLMFRGVHCNLHNPDNPYFSGVHAVATNAAVHDFHSARWLMGQEITHVHAQAVAGEPHPEGAGGCRLLLAQLTMADGAIGIVEMNVDSGYGYDVKVEVTGSQGSIVSAETAAPTVRQQGTVGQGIAGIEGWLDRFAETYVIQAEQWVSTLRTTGRPTGPTAFDGYASLCIADAALRSIKSHAREEVQLVPRPALYD